MILPPLLLNSTELVHTFPSPPITAYVPSGCQDITHCRTISNIVWSCGATIIACIWVAVHPNMMAPTDGWWTKLCHKVTTTLVALIFPESVLAWAIRQRFAAHYLARRLDEVDFRGELAVPNVINDRRIVDTAGITQTAEPWRVVGPVEPLAAYRSGVNKTEEGKRWELLETDKMSLRTSDVESQVQHNPELNRTTTPTNLSTRKKGVTYN